MIIFVVGFVIGAFVAAFGMIGIAVCMSAKRADELADELKGIG